MVLAFEFLDKDFLSEMRLFVLVRGELGGMMWRLSIRRVN